MESDVIQALAKALGPHLGGGNTHYGLKADGTPDATYLYSTAGLFGVCDGPNTLINAMVGPIGIEAVLTWVGTDIEKEFVDALTQISTTGTNQTAVCGDCPSISLLACAQLYCFGRFCVQSNELQFDRIGVKRAGVPVKTLFGAITDANGEVLIGNGETIDDAFMLQTRAVGYDLRRRNSTMIWTGNPANNVNCAYEEYTGLQLIVNTGKFDAYTQLTCDGLDSFLMDFAFNNPASTGTYAIPNWFRRMVLQFQRRAEGANLAWDTAEMFIVMTPNMWDCVSKVYSCTGIDLCAPTGQARINVSADQARDRHEEYLSRRALPIYGKWYPVVLDSQIPETAGQANGTCSDIYFLTTRIQGEEVLFGEYQDFNMTYGKTRAELTAMFGSDDIAITDNGRFALIRDNTRGCFDVQAYQKPRLVSRMPWLSGRIQSVCCSMLQEPLPDVTGSGGVYEKGGGRTTSPIPTLYSDCEDC